VQIDSVSCNNCGAPLEVGAGTNYVTCGHCGSRLAVKRTGSSVYTELLEKIDQKTDAMARQLAELRHHAELERIDREWEQERQGFLTTDKHGNTHEPTTAGAILMGVLLIGFGLFFAVTSGGIGAPFIFPLVGLGFAGFGVYLLVTGPAQAREFQRAQEAFHRRRAAVTPEQFLSSDEEPPAASR
jgi:DNA-directed RNA polymerase subunit RPC12/RpoP